MFWGTGVPGVEKFFRAGPAPPALPPPSESAGGPHPAGGPGTPKSPTTGNDFGKKNFFEKFLGKNQRDPRKKKKWGDFFSNFLFKKCVFLTFWPPKIPQNGKNFPFGGIFPPSGEKF